MFKLKTNKSCLLSKIFLSLGILFLGNMIFTGHVLAYDMPVGIPDPGFGVDAVRPERPNPWDSEVEGYYYIDDTGGCDDNQTYGYPGSPKCYIPDPIPAGSVVEVHGTYSHTVEDLIQINGLGIAESPVWVVGESTGAVPVFSDATLVFGTYIYIEGIHFEFSGEGAILVGRNRTGYKGDHIMIRNCLIEGDSLNKTYAVNTQSYSEDEATEYLIIAGNTIKNHGDIYSEEDQDAHCISINKSTYNTWILDNDISKCSGSGVQIGQDGPLWAETDVMNSYIGRNHIHGNRQAGVGMKSSMKTVISENVIHDQITQFNEDYTAWGSPSKGVGWKDKPQDLWIINNTIYHDSFGIHGGGTTLDDSRIYVVGNVIYDIYANIPEQYDGSNAWSEAGISLVGGNHVYAVNNTVYDSVSGIMTPGIGDDPPTKYYYIENNIVSNIAATTGSHINSENSADETILRNNVIYQPGGGEIITWKGSQYTLSSFQSTFSKGQGCINSDPLFVDASSYDFKLQVNSPAINTALSDTQLTLNIYQEFQDIFGINIRKDINDIPRPQGSAWDIGAYEYIVRSDVDRSGGVVTTDAMLTLRNSLNLDMSLTNWQTLATIGDVNCDGVSNSTDAMLILRYSLGLDMSGTGWCE